jgi:ubiquinone/menaquinone biosynthesis C-methylase UbiE
MRRAGSSCKDPYRNAARTYDLLIGTVNISVKRERRKLAPPRSGIRVLDVGCGTGSDLQMYARVGGLVYGVDLSPAMLQVARKRLGASADLRLASALELPFEDDFFDLVLSTYTLHEMTYRERAAAVWEMMRVVKIEGRVLLTDYLPRRFRSPAGWISAMLIFVFEFTAGREHFRSGRDFIRRGGLDGLVRRCSVRVERRQVIGGGNIAFHLLRKQAGGVVKGKDLVP